MAPTSVRWCNMVMQKLFYLNTFCGSMFFPLPLNVQITHASPMEHKATETIHGSMNDTRDMMVEVNNM